MSIFNVGACTLSHTWPTIRQRIRTRVDDQPTVWCVIHHDSSRSVKIRKRGDPDHGHPLRVGHVCDRVQHLCASESLRFGIYNKRFKLVTFLFPGGAHILFRGVTCLILNAIISTVTFYLREFLNGFVSMA